MSSQPKLFPTVDPVTPIRFRSISTETGSTSDSGWDSRHEHDVAGKGLQEVSFDLCIVDEASKATPTEILVPMSRARKWVLVGDPRQLPPFVEEELRRDSRILADFGLSPKDLQQTVLDRLLAGLSEHSAKSLRRQYLMTA
jgi:superfamily I DNA and/or RNA helicase